MPVRVPVEPAGVAEGIVQGRAMGAASASRVVTCFDHTPPSPPRHLVVRLRGSGGSVSDDGAMMEEEVRTTVVPVAAESPRLVVRRKRSGPEPSTSGGRGGGDAAAERERDLGPRPRLVSWLLGPRGGHLAPTVMRRHFLEAEGGGLPAPWAELVPSDMLRAVERARTPSERRQASDAIARRVAGQALAQSTLDGYVSVLRAYERFCYGEERSVDDGESMAAWLAGKLARGEIVASTARSYLKTLSAVFSRVPTLSTRPLAPGIARDVVQSAERLLGAKATDVHEAVVYDELLEEVALLDDAGHHDLGTMFLVGWNIASRLTNILDTRLCDVTGTPDRLFVAPPLKTDRLRRQDQPVLLTDEVACERLVALLRRRVAEVGGPTGHGQRVWEYEPQEVMRILRQVDGPITTARAMRRGFIHAALATEMTPEQTAVVSLHADLRILRRYTDRVPRSEETLMREVTSAARSVTRSMLPRRERHGVRGLPTMWLQN